MSDKSEDDTPWTPLLIFKMVLLAIGVLLIPTMGILAATDTMHYIPEGVWITYFLVTVFTVIMFPTNRKGQTY